MSKKIILCADGTWNTPHGTPDGVGNTNVRRLYSLVENTDAQLKYYDSGVGTDGSPFEHFFGGAMGEGLFQKVMDGYQFLAYVWDPGDDIYLFGFSRGAYTARSLAGMIALFGVPTRNLDNLTTSKVFEAYRITDHEARKAAKAGLVEEYGLTDVNVRMVGVWDTVGALGVPGHLFGAFDQSKYGFLSTTLSDCIQNAYHAISIDERRAEFAPTLWEDKDGKPLDNSGRVQQVWFAGVHCDVGGSYKETGLSNITLRWMIDNAKACGLTFDETAVEKQFAPRPFNPLDKGHDEWKLIPWGLAKRRTIPPNAVIANTVAHRLARMDPKYAPENYLESAGYKHVVVIPEDELPKYDDMAVASQS